MLLSCACSEPSDRSRPNRSDSGLKASTSGIVSSVAKFHCWRTISRNQPAPSEDHRNANSSARCLFVPENMQRGMIASRDTILRRRWLSIGQATTNVVLQQTRSRQSAQNITDSPQRLGQSIRFSCLRGGDAGQSLRKDLAWTVPIATAKATSLHLDLHRLPLPGQITQTANIGAVIRNFRSRTARTSRPSPTSNPENNIPFDLLHGVQYQQLWLGQRPLHNINGLAHNPNIANSSSLHRKCA